VRDLAAGAGRRRVGRDRPHVCSVSCPPIGALVNTLVVRNSNGLRAIRIGSSRCDTNYLADKLVLHRSGLTLVANKLWYGPGAAARALNDVQHRSSSEVVVPAAPRAEPSLQTALRHPTAAELTNYFLRKK
jgi:hypothetical protein